MKRIIVSSLLIFTLVLSLVGCDMINSVKDKITEKVTEKVEDIVTDTVKEEAYKQAIAYLGEAKYEEAYAVFCELGDYKDAKDHLEKFCFVPSRLTAASKYSSMEMITTFNEQKLPLTMQQTVGEEVIDTIKYTYDENGYLIKQHQTLFEEDDRVREFFYNENDQIIKEIFTEYDGSQEITAYSFDANGNLVHMALTMSDGSVTTTAYEYDEKGNLVKETQVSESAPLYVKEYTYKNDLLTEEKHYSDEELTLTASYTYDALGNLLQIATDTPEGTSSTATYTYDEKGNRITESYSDSYGDTIEVSYTYDSYGNITSGVATAYEETITMEIEYTLTYIVCKELRDSINALTKELFGN